MPPTPRPILVLAGLASAVAIVVGAIRLYGVVRGEAWLAVAFEAAIVLSGVFGLLAAVGRFRESHALALFCAGGTILLSSAMGYLAGHRLEGAANLGAIVREMAHDRATAALVASGGSLFALSGLVLLARRPRASGRYLALGLALGAPVAAAGAAWMATSVRATVQSMPPIGQTALAFFGFLVFCALASASVHCLIRAFEVGRAE